MVIPASTSVTGTSAQLIYSAAELCLRKTVIAFDGTAVAGYHEENTAFIDRGGGIGLDEIQERMS